MKKWLEKLKMKFKSSKKSSEDKGEKKNHRRILWPLLGVVIVLCVIGGVGMKATSSDKFCTSCHEMTPEADTWKLTSHAKVSCVSCHEGEGIGNYLKFKVTTVSFIFKHFTGQVPEQIVTTVPITTQVCESCHSSARVTTASGDINIPHDKHLQQGITCTACHAGVSHNYIAERGLTKKEDNASWTTAKAQSVSQFDASKTTMEACMDCHEQVNAGKKPWEENQGLGKSEQQKVAENDALAKQAAISNGKLPQSVTVSVDAKSALQAPVRCAPCHLNIKTPNNHVDKAWADTLHGVVATQDVTNCASCHSRERDRVLLTPQTSVQDYARNNTLCAPCHEKRPAGHLANQQLWLPAHSSVIKAKGAQNCLVCHDIEKSTVPNAKKLPGVSTITCNTCHWFKNGKIE